MYYQFLLEWEDLPEEVREKKIDEYLRKGYKNDPEQFAYEQGGKHIIPGIEEVLNDSVNRTDADRRIAAHFPIYF